MTIVKDDNTSTAKRKIARHTAAGDHDRLNRFLAAWLGHARFADSANLIRSLNIEAGGSSPP